MIGYLIRRTAIAIVILIGISVIVFALLHMISSSPGRAILGPKASAQAVAAFNKQNGYDDPLIVQYLRYIGDFVQWKLGFSYKTNQTVNALMSEYAPRSMYLSGVSLVLAIVIAIPLGVFQAVRRNRPSDLSITGLTFVLYSMPSFFLGVILIQLFALNVHIFPSEASQAQTLMGVIGDPIGMVLPVATLVLIQVAGYSRYMRSSALDVLAQDYIKVARAKGLSERLVLGRHLLRNASLPMITLVGLSIPILLAGNLVTEDVFNYKGLGLMFVNSLGAEDYNPVLAYTLIGGVLTVIGNFIADIALTVADPRIRLV